MHYFLKVLCEKEKDKYPVDWTRLDENYKKAKEQLKKCLPFEKQLLELEARDHQKRAAVYAEYIEQGRDFLNDQLVQVLYERMVTDCCLSGILVTNFVLLRCLPKLVVFSSLLDGLHRVHSATKPR